MAQQTKALKDAVAGVNPAFEALIDMGARCMEQMTDRRGIVCERWILPSGKSAIVYGTPHWRDVFIAVSGSDKWEATVAALKAYGARKEAAQPESLQPGPVNSFPVVAGGL